MSALASQITGVSIVWSSVRSGADQRKHQSSASLAFAQGIQRWPVDSPHRGPVTRKMFPFPDVIIFWSFISFQWCLLINVPSPNRLGFSSICRQLNILAACHCISKVSRWLHPRFSPRLGLLFCPCMPRPWWPLHAQRYEIACVHHGIWCARSFTRLLYNSIVMYITVYLFLF